MNIQLLLTGDELMSGDTVDSNSAQMAQRLKALGLVIARKITVGDDLALLRESIERMSQSADVLIINGGLGPTVDDLTSQALAETLGVEVVLHDDAMADLQAMADRIGLTLNDANIKQAYLPEGAVMIPNPVGTACGFRAVHNDCVIYCTPGVPRELFTMLDEQILPHIQSQFHLRDKATVTRLRSFGLGESTLQQIFTEQLPPLADGVELGFRAHSSGVELKITSRGSALEAANAETTAAVKALLPEHIFGVNDDTLASVLIDVLRERKQTIATAESCTGGGIAAKITAIAGSSDVFEAGYVTYSNRIKTQQLGVAEETLQAHGAVSEAVVREMVRGALSASQADIAVAVSGIAGPGGGSEEKPVGTVWIGWGYAGAIHAAHYCFPYERTRFQHIVGNTALDLVRREVLGLSTGDCHFKSYRKG